MNTYAEKITAYEAKRVSLEASLKSIMDDADAKGETLDAEQDEQFKELEGQIKAVDTQLERYRTMENLSAKGAKPVHGGNADEGSETRGGRIVVKTPQKLAPGIAFARLAKVRSVARLDNEPVLQVAERMYGADSEVAAVVKATVAAGSTVSGNWAADLVGAETSTFADFAEYLRPATILGQFGQGGVPSLRMVPFREPLISQTGGGAAAWVGEGKPKPLTSLDFDRTTLEPLKVATICVLTEENVRSSAPASEGIVRDSIRDAVAARIDQDFIDPTNTGTSNVKPASITNGAAHAAASGTGDADDVRADVRSLLNEYINANNPPRSGVIIMPTAAALALSLMVNALGQNEFNGISMTGGMLLGIPVITSDYLAAGYIVMVNASDIYEADEGGVNVDMSREASLEMKDSSFTQDQPTGSVLVSLWQNNLVGLRAERTINWKRRRASAVAYLTGAAWGGAVNDLS
jgi:HK97 family phage major capsid protein